MNREKKVALHLLQSKAIKLETTNPFTWASGWKSPIYCDNRKTLSYPETRDFIRDQFVSVIKEQYSGVEYIAGVATGAIAQGVLVAQELNLPFIYVRSSPKSHGLENLVEGIIDFGKKVVVVEDLVSTGGSSLKAVQALRKEGFDVMGMCAIFTYGFSIAEKNFDEAACKLIALSNYEALLEPAIEQGQIKESDLDVLKKWCENPGNWKME
jgi:orotate phosphoribosyltransferase